MSAKNLEMRYATVKDEPQGGVFDATFDVAKGELFTLLGPSGCGKSTTLRSIAGLELPQRGDIALDGSDIFTRRPVRSYPCTIGTSAWCFSPTRSGRT